MLAGDDDTQLLLAARSLALMTVAHPGPGETVPSLGDSVRLGDFPLPAPRQPDDAPRWLNTQNLISLWSYSSEQAMQSNGSSPIPVYFRVPPDLYYGETQNLNLRMNYRYNARPLATGSALRMFVNGSLINEAPLPPGQDFQDRSAPCFCRWRTCGRSAIRSCSTSTSSRRTRTMTDRTRRSGCRA